MPRSFILGAPRRGAFLIIAAALTLNGCATSGYNIAADDPCGAQRADLKAVEDSYVQGAITGALGGAVGGALLGGLIGGDAKGALIGAGAGAMVGGLGGYYLAKQNAASDRGSLVSSIYGDVAAENAKLDRVTGAFRQIRECRLRTANEIKTAFAQRQIERPAAEARLQRIRTLFSEDIQVAEALGAKMEQRGGELQFASDELLKQDPVAQKEVAQIKTAAAAPPPPPRPTPRPQQQAQQPRPRPAAVAPVPAPPAPQPAPNTTAGVVTLTESNQVKRQAFGSELQQAKAEAATAFELQGGISHLPGMPEVAG